MAEAEHSVFRSQLLKRRDRLQTAVRSGVPNSAEIQHLLNEVDGALERMHQGTYGLCETCHDAIEPERLMADPLTCYCLDHLDEAQRRALQRDLELAVQIQFALLPNRDLKVPGWDVFYHYQPAGPVSGDYCDLIPVKNDGGGLLFLAGDVSGKGVAASLLMSNLHAIFRSLYSTGMPVSELITRANRIFCESTLSPFYATLLCGLAKPSGEVDLCNAGHCPPLVLHGNDVTTIESTGLPVGLFSDAQYSVCSTRLNPGDLVVAYTDGLTEARNGNDEEYGKERLLSNLSACSLMAPKEVGRRCVEDLAKFMAGQSLADDLTLIVLRHGVSQRS